jgi:hypothetical protein
MHYAIVIAIIAVIVIIQIRFFANTKRKIGSYTWIFPEDKNGYQLGNVALLETIDATGDEYLEGMLATAGLQMERYYYTKVHTNGEEKTYFRRKKARNDLKAQLSDIVRISVSHDNSTLATIIESINDYLKNNKSASDYHLMKDIVDRNCDAQEEDISTQIPIPLYMGLVGTMAGILIGILYLWLSGSMGDLLSAGGGSGADGVEALLGGVALAMISSILGIVLTTWASVNFKTAKAAVESDKHCFLSWIQATLLPSLSDNVADTLERMSRNLSAFNDTFSSNTSDLGQALSQVNDSYRLQTQLLDTVNRLQEKDITSNNLTLLGKLLECSKQIGILGKYLENVNDYLENVRTLNDRLDLQESRTREIEEMAKFFKSEIKEIESRKAAITKTVGTVDDYLQQALEKLKVHADAQFAELLKSTGKQQDLLKQKTEEITSLVDELKNLSEIRKGIVAFENAIKGQNAKIENLTNAIARLAEMKSDTASHRNDLPKWLKIAAIAGIGNIAVGCTILAVKSFMS